MGNGKSAEGDASVTGALGSLALACVRPASSMLVLRSLRWYRDLGRLGMQVPFFVVHDLGLVLSTPREQFELGPRAITEGIIKVTPAVSDAWASYRAFLNEVSEGEVARRARALRLSDDLIVVVLARLLGPVTARSQEKAAYGWAIPLELEILRDLEARVGRLYAAVDRSFEVAYLQALRRFRLHVLTLIDAMDLDTLRLLGLLGPESSAAGALAHVDLLAALTSPVAADISSFSFELLPSVLETSHAKGLGTHAVHGYAGIGTKGSLDSLVLTEVAWSEDEFARRMFEGELLYYAREQVTEDARRVHYILMDASASMRGDREVFARGLGIALAKKLQLAGEDVWLRFFDSRLYDIQRVRPGQLPTAYVLGFKGERGRNPARVFAQLATELALLRIREQREPVVHVLTHAGLHVPRPLMMEVSRQARVFGVFILPSGGTLDLDYVDVLDGSTVVDHSTLQQRKARVAAAATIVDAAGKMAKGRGGTSGPSVSPPAP